MKYEVLFSLKKKEKVFINVVCCSRDWRFKGEHFAHKQTDFCLWFTSPQ